MKLNSIRFKASVLFTSILCLILIAFSGSLFGITRHILYRNLDEELSIKAAEIVNILRSYEKLKKTETQQQHLINKLLGIKDRARLIIDDLWRSDVRTLNLKNDYINILNIAGQPIIKSQNFDDNVTALFRNNFPPVFNALIFNDINNSTYRLRVINLPFAYGNRHLHVIQVGTSLQSTHNILKKLLYFIGASILFILGLTSFLGSFFASRILKPVLNITKIADDISHTDLNLRIDETEVDEEMKRLIRSFNAMIDRIEKSFEHINEFSSHVAHELKTPLAIIKGEMELALIETRDVSEYKRVMNVSLEEIDRLVKIIKDLLLLARLDYNPEVFQFETLNLVEFLSEIHAQSNVLSIDKKIEVSLDVPSETGFVEGDKVHLNRLFLNLIINAIKFTPHGGNIIISLTMTNDNAHIAISDTGIGIAKKDLVNIFNQFFRAHQYDPDSVPGSGLGLSIARSIAKAHHGTIEVESEPSKGAKFSVILPLTALTI